MTTTKLPDSASLNLRLVHPTEKEKVEQWSKNGVSWKGALSLEAYQRRERYLLQAPLAKDGGLTHWILVDSDAEDRQVFAGCETLKKKALMAWNGKVEDIICHGIGSVFSPPEYRGRGYGRRLMKELGPKLESWQSKDKQCLFSVLYSDIGKVGHNQAFRSLFCMAPNNLQTAKAPFLEHGLRPSSCCKAFAT